MAELKNIPENGDLNENAYEFSLDAILVRIGQFGKFQLFVLTLICLPMIFYAALTVGYIFIAGTVSHRCRVPECDGPKSVYQEPSTEFTIPKSLDGVLDDCHRFLPYNRSLDIDVCFAGNFDKNYQESCGNDFIFRDEEVTVSNEFNIFCDDEWKLSLTGTVNNFGQFFGIPLGGYLSDRYGRRTMLAMGGFLSGIMGIIRSFSPNYYFFLAIGFLENFCGSPIYPTVFIIGVEFVGTERRLIGCTTIATFIVVGEVVLALVAKYTQNWRSILRYFYTPAIGMIAFLWILPESIRWLVSKGEEEKATYLLKKAAAMNKRKLSDHSIEKHLKANRIKLAKESGGKLPIREAFHSLFWRIVCCSFCWFSLLLIFYGLSLTAVTLDGNKYNNFIYAALVEIPGLLLPFCVMNRLGRRFTLFGSLVINAISVGATVLVGPDMVLLKMCLFLIGKMIISAALLSLYFFTSEIFPTNVRNSLFSFCSMFGRFGSMLAPQVPILQKYFHSGPAILFTVCALLSSLIALKLPETTNVVLPTTTLEAEEIGKNKKPRS